MEDPKLILTITAFDVFAGEALDLSHNHAHLWTPNPPAEAAAICSRETTPFPNDPQESRGLRLNLDDRLKDIRSGWVFGSDPELCDVLVSSKGKQHGISRRHFCITFDGQRRLVLNDISTYGSRVSYTGQGRNESRRGFTWILLSGWKIQVQLHPDRFIFNLELATHQLSKDEFESRVDSFLEARNAAAPPLDLLRIRSQTSTAPPTQPMSPRSRPIYIFARKLGEGAFGSVHEVIDVSTGETYAAKQFAQSTGFEVEVGILKRISHKHIVEYVDLTEGPSPFLIMEYLKLGDLDHLVRPLTSQEAELLLKQSLEALEYLHKLEITHRDIKPGNILVKGRKEKFHIKLADFGLSKDVVSLKTWCGSGVYAAPEIWKTYAKPTAYTNKVDVWSLGVVMLEVYSELPIDAQSAGLQWCRKITRIVDDLNREDAAAPMSLLADMLRLDYSARLSAKDSLQIFHDMNLGRDDWSGSEVESEVDAGNSSDTVNEGQGHSVSGRGRHGSVTPRTRSPQRLRSSKAEILQQNLSIGDGGSSRQASITPRARSPQRIRSSEAETLHQTLSLGEGGQRHTKRRRTRVLSTHDNMSQEGQTKRWQGETNRAARPASKGTICSGSLWQVDTQPDSPRTMNDAILALLRNLHRGRTDIESNDERTSAMIASVSKCLRRLRVDHLDTEESHDGSSVTITAASEEKRFGLGKLTSSDLARSTNHVALCLLLMLRLRSAEASSTNE